jgi:hypothetical protein
MEEPIVILNGKQIFATGSPEAAEIIELTQEMLVALDEAKAKEN